MFTRPYTSGQLACERQRETPARAGRQRLGRQLHVLAGTSRRVPGAGRGPGRWLRTEPRLHVVAGV
ncbi:MAG: hypothetical protein JO132_11700 [Streptosporangiaceae bacterium]|nr:hypothetical protein [Streptosporangiaceae bacterium]